MKRMVTEEEIAEIASQNSKPLYRYNANLNYYVDDTDYSADFDFVSSVSMMDLPTEDAEAETIERFYRALIGGKFTTFLGFKISNDVLSPAEFTLTYTDDSNISFNVFNGDSIPHPIGDGTFDGLIEASQHLGLRITAVNLNTGESKSWDY